MKSLDDRIDRWRRFMRGDERIKRVFWIDFENPVYGERPLPLPDRVESRLQWILGKYSDMLDRCRRIDDDAIPFLDLYTGTEIFAEAFGCEVVRSDDAMPYARPMIENTKHAAKLTVPMLENTTLTALFDMADRLREKAGHDAVFRLPDIQSPMGITALIWEKNHFYLSLVDDPNAIRTVCNQVMQLLQAFLDEWFSRYGRAFVAHFPDYYMEQGITLSEDEIGCVSETMFQEYFMPDLQYLSMRYNGIGLHSCAHAVHQWSNFQKIRHLKLLNLVQSPEIIEKAYDVFAPVCAQMHISTGLKDIHPNRLPTNAHVVIKKTVQDEAEAQRWLNAW